MERILSHWMNLDSCEPSLKIVCPQAVQDIAKPHFGVHNEGCPNLLWELRRARRAELTAAQLATKNPTEKIVDKDNHLRDALKYLLLAAPCPSEKTWRQKAAEELAQMAAIGDLTSCAIRYQLMSEEEEPNYRPATLGRRAARRWR